MGLTVYGGGGKPEEEKTVTAGTSAIVVNPSSGKVMKKVTVNPTPTESKSVTPTTSELTVTPSAGKHLSQVVVGAVEDVTPEVTAQTPVITQIAENFDLTITTPSGTNKQILQGNNANLLNIKNNAKKEGAYVWKKLTADGGDFIDFVVSDSETAYPDGAVHTDGYWYQRVVEGIKGEEIFFTQSTASRTVTIPHSLGVVPTGFHLRVTTYDERTNGVKTVVCPFTSDSSARGVYKFSGNSSIQNGGFEATITNTEITIDTNSNSWTFAAGYEYRMIVWA